MSDASDGLGLAKPLPPRPMGAAAPRPAPVTPPATVIPPAPAATAPTIATAPKPLETPPRRTEGHAPIIPTPRRDTEQRRLIVGREISLTGEINSCDRLIVEGSVEANLTNCREVEISETGLLKGTATVDDAEIRGRFEGNVTVRKRLLVRSTGKVTGTIKYGLLEVEAGGQVSGDVQAQPLSEDEIRPSRVVSMASDLKV